MYDIWMNIQNGWMDGSTGGMDGCKGWMDGWRQKMQPTMIKFENGRRVRRATVPVNLTKDANIPKDSNISYKVCTSINS